MAKLKMFYLPNCPFCKKAFKYIDEVKAENPELKNVEIETIDESVEKELADSYDYYYVPTFYMNEEKLHEGGIFKNEVKSLLEKAAKS
jgi:thiol-disulfide isomerase/thioredoxin